MIINTNMSAIKAEGNLKRVNEKSSKVIEKLSSGLRVNRAADDSAGLTISEKMRAQIRGLSQASRNLQDGTSFVQTADGALGTVHTILDRAKELCVQAANDTNTLEDRQKINEELKQLNAQIDKIGTDTEFNTLKVFEDGLTSDDAAMRSMIAEVWVASALDAIYNTFGSLAAAGSGEDMELVFTDLGPGTMASMQSSLTGGGDATNFILTINTYYFDPAKIYAFENSGGGDAVTSDELYDKIIAHEMMHAVMFDVLEDDMFPSASPIPSWFVEGVAEAVGGGYYRIKGMTTADIQTNLNTSGIGTLSDYSSGYAASLYLGFLAGGKDMDKIGEGLNKIFQNMVDYDHTFDQALQDVIKMNQSDFEDDFKASTDAADFINALKTKVSTTGSGSVLVVPGPPLTVSKPDTIADTTHSDISSTRFVITPTSLADTTLMIQAGANAGQQIALNRFGLSSMLLGMPPASSLGTQASYSSALSSYDNAVNKVSDMRCYYGAVQNRMEYATRNADNYGENLQASESRIRDANMSTLMMEFTKTNIISQAATSMLAQANQLPQNILTLLR